MARQITPHQHTEACTELIRKRYAANPEPFRELLQRETITLDGYARKAELCHRATAQLILVKIAAKLEMPVEAQPVDMEWPVYRLRVLHESSIHVAYFNNPQGAEHLSRMLSEDGEFEIVAL